MAKRVKLSNNEEEGDAAVPVDRDDAALSESEGGLEDLDDSEDDLSGLGMQANSDDDEGGSQDDEDDDMDDIIAANEDAQSKQKKSMPIPLLYVCKTLLDLTVLSA